MESVSHFDLVGKLGSHGGLEGFGKVLANHEDYFRESRSDRIEYRVVEDSFPIGPHGIHLLKATITAAHASCENDECGGIYHVGLIWKG